MYLLNKFVTVVHCEQALFSTDPLSSALLTYCASVPCPRSETFRLLFQLVSQLRYGLPIRHATLMEILGNVVQAGCLDRLEDFRRGLFANVLHATPALSFTGVYQVM